MRLGSLLLLFIAAGDAIGEQHENAQKIFGSFRRAERRHGWRDHRIHSSRFPRFLEVRGQDEIQYNAKPSHRRRVSVTYYFMQTVYSLIMSAFLINFRCIALRFRKIQDIHSYT